MKHYSFLTEGDLLPNQSNDRREVGDPQGGVSADTQRKRMVAKDIKADSELIAAKAQLQKTKHDAGKIQQQIQMDQEEQANIEADKQRQMQQSQQPQDPTVDPNAAVQPQQM